MPGVYGTVRAANVNPLTDVKMYYHYRPTRGTLDDVFGEDFVELDNTCLVKSSGITTGDTVEAIKGLYSLRLPMDQFSEKGIYTIYIKPSEFELKIVDVSILENYNNPVVEGIVINSDDVDGNIDLTGYRVEYYDSNGEITDTVRLITSCNACEPVKVTVGDSYARSTRYRISNVSSNKLLFCTLTPSTSSSYKPNSSPSPGYVGQTIHIVNTKFNPVLLEVTRTSKSTSRPSSIHSRQRTEHLCMTLRCSRNQRRLTAKDKDTIISSRVKNGSRIKVHKDQIQLRSQG